MPDISSKRQKFWVVAVIESALVVQVILTVVVDPTRTRIMASMIELVIIAVTLFVGWWFILGRK